MCKNALQCGKFSAAGWNASRIKPAESMVSMEFSKRTAWNTEESDLARAYRDRLDAGLPVADLTASNPTRCGFEYAANLLDPLIGPGAFDYDPDPRGTLEARKAVCRYYARHEVHVSPEQIMLTTSTSEAYGYLFKLLMNPGDTIFVPQPGYPLFDFLAQAESVELAQAPLFYDHGWQLDLEGLRQQITARTRAVVLVHPNNPTGHFTKLNEAKDLAAICREHGLALIVDEVFLDYALDSSDPWPDHCSFAARDLGVPTFIVSGISKICGLPQMKVAWLVARGPDSQQALARLEVLADTWLSMNAPIQQAFPIWLDARDIIGSSSHRTIARRWRSSRQSAADRGRMVRNSAYSGASPRRGDSTGTPRPWSLGASRLLFRHESFRLAGRQPSYPDTGVFHRTLSTFGVFAPESQELPVRRNSQSFT